MSKVNSLQDASIVTLFNSLCVTYKYLRAKEARASLLLFLLSIWNAMNICLLFLYSSKKSLSYSFAIYVHILLFLSVAFVRDNMNNKVVSRYLGLVNHALRPCFLHLRVKDSVLELKSAAEGEKDDAGLQMQH